MNDITAIPTEIVNALRKPLPKEAIKQHPTKTFLSTIKTIYSIERLNEVFGMNGWSDHYEFITKQDPHPYTDKKGNPQMTNTMIVVKGELHIPAYGIRREAFGGHDNEDLGDAYKGACTDALSKMVSSIYIGMDVYKGNPNAPAQSSTPAPAARPAAPQQQQTPLQQSNARHVPGKTITQPQQNRLFAITKAANASTDDVKVVLKSKGYEHSKDITMDDYEAICNLFTSGQWTDVATPGTGIQDKEINQDAEPF